MMKVPIKFLKEYKELFNNKNRYLVFYGGRNSGKSWHTAIALILRGRQKKLRILCTREIQITIKDSVHKLLKDLIHNFGFNDYEVKNENIVNRITGTEFIFKGVKHNIQEIKSMEGIDIAWVEEAQSITKESLDVLTPTIRKEGSQIILTFNRFNELDPVYEHFVMGKPDGTYVRKVNYDVLEKHGMLTDTIKQEIENDKKNPDLYAHKWLGEPINQSNQSIIPRSEIVEAMERNIEPVGAIEVGVDVARMGADRTVFYKRKGLKIIDKKIYSQQRINETYDQLINFIDMDKGICVKVDDSGLGGGLTDMLLNGGYNVVPINFGGEPKDKDKYPNLISEAWFYLKSIIKEVDIPQDNDLLMELSTRQFKMDNKGRRVIESKDDYKKRGFRSPDLADALILTFINYHTFNVENDFMVV